MMNMTIIKSFRMLAAILLCTMFTSLYAAGDESSTKRTIHVATAGTLPDLIQESEKYSIEELTLTGELNGTDFRLIRDMAGNNYLGKQTSGKLVVLDITNVKIAVGDVRYLDTGEIKGNNSEYYHGNYHYTITDSEVIPPGVFFCCRLQEVRIPNYVTRIGNSAFEGCSSLISFAIPNSVKGIGDSAFGGCSGLTSITIPNSVTSIGKSAFYSCI